VTDSSRDRTGRALVYGCLFLSGLSALVYEVAWMRQVRLTVGATTAAVSTVLAVYMGGLAAGASLFGRMADRSRAPLRLYGYLEAGIGLYALLLPQLLEWCTPGYVALARGAAGQPTLLVLLRVGLAALILFAPTILMGGTLPVLSQALARSELGVGRAVGGLYAINTAGAVVGVVAAGYVLLPAIGNRATLLIAACANLAVGVGALLLARSRSRASTEADQSVTGRMSLASRLTLAAFAVSGGISMIYEVAWTRALALVIGSSTYAFTAMLVAVLTGIAGGSALYSWLWGARPASPRAFATLQAGIGVTTAVVIALYPRMPELFLASLGWSESPGFVQLIQLFVSACALLPATLVIGATFPCAVAVVSQDRGRIGQDVGRVYAANTLGAIAGAAAGGFLVVPALGVHGSLAAASAGNLALAAVLFAATAGWRSLRWAPTAATALAVFGAWHLPAWDHGVMSSGPAIYARAYRRTPDEFARRLRRQSVVFYRDGTSGSVSVHREGDTVFLRVNGKTDASSGPDMPTQLLSGHVPLFLHPEPRSVLIIGMGSGVSAGAVARHPIRRLDMVEIEPAVVEASRFFASVNHDVLKDPRVRLVIADGRNFLLTSPDRYDVIISEPSNPWIGGLAALFSREFFELARSRLAAGGLMLQWLQAYSLSLDDLRMVVRTFRAAFPAVSIWSPAKGDLLLVGSAEPVAIDPLALAQRYAEHAGPRTDLQRIGVHEGAAIAGYLALSEEDTARFAEGTRLNTDDRLPLEFSAPRALYLDTVDPNFAAIAAARRATPSPALEHDLDRVGGAGVRYELGRVALLRNDPVEARRQFARAVTLEPGHVPSSLELADLADRSGQWDLALGLARGVLARQADNARANFLAGLSSARVSQPGEARRFLQRAVELSPGNAEYVRALMMALSP